MLGTRYYSFAIVLRLERSREMAHPCKSPQKFNTVNLWALPGLMVTTRKMAARVRRVSTDFVES